jgi:arabinose-5-phosphate isomerase
MPDDSVMTRMAQVLTSESQAIAGLAASIDQQKTVIHALVERIVTSCGEQLPGRLITTGIGKAGFIARKTAATFASTGTPALYLHPTEARHGDLGMVRSCDVVLAFSNSGSSEEVVHLIPDLRRIGAFIAALVGNTQSPLTELADLTLSIGKVIEACPLGLAPSTSTTTLLALGDALALTVLEERKFTPEQYARFHPGGALGRRLMTCREAMRPRDRMAVVQENRSVVSVMQDIGRARTGSAIIVDVNDHMIGIFTDGDLRRRLVEAKDTSAFLHQPVGSVATRPGLRVSANALVETALHLCSQKKINELPVVDADGVPLGLIDVQDLADRGFAI